MVPLIILSKLLINLYLRNKFLFYFFGTEVNVTPCLNQTQRNKNPATKNVTVQSTPDAMQLWDEM